MTLDLTKLVEGKEVVKLVLDPGSDLDKEIDLSARLPEDYLEPGRYEVSVELSLNGKTLLSNGIMYKIQ